MPPLSKEQILDWLKEEKESLQKLVIDQLSYLESRAKSCREDLPKWKPGDYPVCNTDEFKRIVGMIEHAFTKQNFIEDQIELMERMK